MQISKRKAKDKLSRSESDIAVMSSTTKGFLRKICHIETMSIDMTEFGFIRDSKVFIMKLWIKPLFLQLEKICGKSELNSPIQQFPRKVHVADHILTKKGTSKPKKGNHLEKRRKTKKTISK